MKSGGKAYIPPHRRGTAARKQDSKEIKISSLTELSNRFTQIYCINLRRREDRWKTFSSRMRSALGESDRNFIEKVKRFDAVDGNKVINEIGEESDEKMPKIGWDASKNALYDRHIQPPLTKHMTPGEVGCAMSHIKLWKLLLESQESNATMLILEDDAIFYSKKKVNPRYANRRNLGFTDALSSVYKILPSDWDILYLGFSDRGERKYIQNHTDERLSVDVRIFRPEYGFHTHAYVVTKSAASTLLSNLPVNGPLDVWLADNEWFGLNIYCCVVANEGWHGQGASLISQRRHDTKSDIAQSGRTENKT